MIPVSQLQGVPNASKQPGEVMLVLEATGEPRMQSFSVIGSAMIDKALDNLGQSLFVTMADPQINNNGGFVWAAASASMRGGYSPYNNLQQRHVVVRLKAGEKQSGFKELKGSLTAQMLERSGSPDYLRQFAECRRQRSQGRQWRQGGSGDRSKAEQR